MAKVGDIINVQGDPADYIAVPRAPRQVLMRLHDDITDAAKDVMTRKNQDYANAKDPFANFRTFGGLGILVRLSDKLARLRQYEERGIFTVADESLKDTVLDGINYLILYYAYKHQESHDNQLDVVRSASSGTVAQEVPSNGRTRVDG